MQPAELDINHLVKDNRLIGIWQLMAGFRFTYLASTVCLAISALFDMGPSLLMLYLVDNVLKRSDPLSLLPLVALGFLGLAVFQGIFGFLSNKLAAATGEGIALRLRTSLFDHIQRLTFSYYDRTQTGDLIQRATSDVDMLRSFFVDQSTGLGRIVLVLVINLVALLSLNTNLALLVLAGVPLVIGVTYFFRQKISKLYQGYQEQGARLSTTLQESLTGMRVVKAFARQAYEQDKFEQENWKQFLQWRRMSTTRWTYYSISMSFCIVLTLIGSYFGALMTMDGAITLGTFLAYVGIMGRILWNVRDTGGLIVSLSNGSVSYTRIATILKETREPLDEENSSFAKKRQSNNLQGEFVFENVRFGYDKNNPVLKDISFRCTPGQSVALLGSTGSGKTSLINLVPRFYEYTDGSLKLDGVELKEYPYHYLRSQIGIVEQEPFLFSRTIRENIAYGVGRDVSQDEIEAAAQAAAIHDEILSFPNGYDTLVGERGVKLSGGQKQRVAIARALLRDPRILILDDATASVDTETAGKIQTALERLMRGRTTFIVTHRIQSVMNADLILVLDHGQIVQQGPHDKLLAQDGIYRRIYDAQALIDAALQKEVENAA